MYAYNFEGNLQPDLKLLIEEYEKNDKEGAVPFMELKSFLTLIDYYDVNGQLRKALAVIGHALQQHQYSALLFIRKAQLLADEDDCDAAFDALDKAALFEPSNIEIILTQIDIYIQLSQYEEALDSIEEAFDIADEKSEKINLYILQATVHELLDDDVAAIRSLKRALKYTPQQKQVLNRLRVAYDMADMPEASIEFHQKHIDDYPYAFMAWYNLAKAYVEVGLLEKAAEAFDYTIVINEKFEPAYRDYIVTLIDLSDYSLALRYLNEYQEHFEADAEIWFRIGGCYEHKEAYHEARTFFHKALATNNLNGEVYFHIGNCYVEESSWQLAYNSYLKAYEADNYNEEFCLSLADACASLDKVDEAHDYYQKAIALAPSETVNWIHYIEFLIDEEQYNAALNMLSEAKIHTDDLLLDCVHAAILLEAGNRKEGLAILISVLSQDVEMGKKLFIIAPMLEEDKDVVQLIMDFANA